MSPDSGTVAIPLRVRQKTIVVKVDNSVITDTSFTQAQDVVPLLAFSVSNKDYDDPLKVKGLRLAFFNSEGDNSDENLLSSRALFSMVKRISVTSADEVLAKTESVESAADFVDFIVSETDDNPLQLLFDPEAEMAAGAEAKFLITAEFQDNIVNRGFRAVLRSVDVYDFDPESPLEIIDSVGVKIEESKNLESRPFTIISDNPKDSFGAYPNPFGRTYKQNTIMFRLENPSDVEVRIFTLLGEPVWSRSFTGLSSGLYENLVHWDGKNGRGKTVLNGVYLCTINIRPLSGGAKKRYITKIAYIK